MLLIATIASCDSDVRSTEPGNPSAGNNTNADWSIQLSPTSITLTEGGGFVSTAVTITRGPTSTSPITLSSRGLTPADDANLTVVIGDPEISGEETSTNVSLQLQIGPHPLQSHTRTLVIAGNDGLTNEVTAQLNYQVQPTNRPDVYLILGQSNAVGFSEDNAKLSLAGQPDAPLAGVNQLNVTGNDSGNFSSASDFTNNDSLYNVGEPISPALDPLHSGYNFQSNSKEGQRIGFGLSFAKRAAVDANGDIILVPAAWSDTGFCTRITNRFPGMGWNATAKSNSALAGTLLHDRAIARANIALTETGGILRGILWHQGEADSDNAECASLYGDNLAELAASLRTNIQADARGPAGRGATAEIPFVVGTMSQGEDIRDSQLPFSQAKQVVDGVHRNVSNLIPNSGFVNNDDLVPPAYSCGEGTCVHFGAAALREMGSRYYDVLNQIRSN